MPTEISKAYEPQSVEEKWYDFWLKQNCFTADPGSPKPAYSIVIPPPNVTGVLHMGHVLNNTIQDILARKARMDGQEVLWLPGTDHAGIATQAVVEKALRKQGLMRHRDDLGREKFLEHVWAWKEKHGGIIIQQLKKLGCSCDWTRERFTMDPAYSRCVQRVFVELYRKGLIYRGKRMVNWDPAARTALSDEEVEMVEEKGHLWYLKYPLLDDKGQPKGDEFVVVATTRPETMLGDEAVAVNPADPRFTHLAGRRCLLPLQNKAIPVIADDFVDPKFGTGCVKVTPAHDPNDYAMAERHDLPLTVVIGPDGAMTPEAGEDFNGLDRMEARQAVIEELTEQGLLLKTEDYVHNVGYSQRSHVPVEPYLSEQWFLEYPSVEQATASVELGSRECKMAEVATVIGDAAVLGGESPVAHLPEEKLGIRPAPSTAANITDVPADVNPASRGIRFHPDRWAKTYAHWMENLRDWCISRQLWWGHRVPVWYNQAGWHALEKPIQMARVTGDELPGRTARELRQAAWRLAEQSGFLRQRFRNLDTGWDIYVNRRSLEHAFANEGLANIKLIPALPQLLQQAALIATEPHVPPIPQVRLVHKFLAGLQLGTRLYRVKLTVKELRDGRKLYDHQALLICEADGKSPGTHPLARKLVTRPTSASHVTLAQIAGDVNTDQTFTRCQIESPGGGWSQDPDVLDTWFSSWLWPFATMGWPEQTETLRKFYPTTDLVTAPDIIFFWVARMIMAGCEFMGDLPFRNVYFTGIIRDKLGRKMSKSLGNSPDPLELIAQYGADALRFGTMRSAPLGQDVLFDEKDVELGRNFCNKLWNACRFRQMQGGQVQGEIAPALLSGDDKWILLKLDQAIREITDAFAGYRFNEATHTLYRFFWSEYCDWYVEASKAILARPAGAAGPQPAGPGAPSTPRRANTLAVLDFVLSHTLRLLHPFLPFITEELWHGMGFHEEMPDNQGGRTIMNAPWPKPLDEDFRAHYGLDEACLAAVNLKYQLVTQGRNLRREANLPAGKKVKFVFKPAQPLAPQEADVLRLLLNAAVLEINPAYQPPKGTPTVHSDLGDLYLPLEGQVDTSAEQARLAKELEKCEAEITKAEQKLNNPHFTAKAPAHVLQEHRQRLADWQAKRERVKAALEALRR